MPSLNWIRKDKVLNHHNEVPYRVLDKKYNYGDEDAGNMVFQSKDPGYAGAYSYDRFMEIIKEL